MNLFDRHRILYIIKHNRILKSVIISIGGLFLRIIGLFVKTNNHLILFVSNGGNSIYGSPYEIYKEIRKRDLNNKYYCIWALNDIKNKNEEIQTVKFDSIKYYLLALKAKYWVTDNNIDRGMNFKKKDTVYLNTWHGIAMKKIGNDDKYSGKYNYSYLDYICVSGDYDKKVFSSSLKVKNSAFVECGMPRNDYLFQATTADNIRIRKKLNIPMSKIVILYAPTWRDSTNGGVDFDLNLPIHFDVWERELGQNYCVLFRAHDRTTKIVDVEYNHFVMDFSNYHLLNDLLIIADILVTDYSSIVFDYCILKKPFFCYGYDYDEYCNERGFYIDLKEVYGNNMFTEEHALLNAIVNIDMEEQKEKAKSICETFMSYSKGEATNICVKYLLGDKLSN